MKKMISMLLALVMVFGLTACGGNTEPTEAPTEAVVIDSALSVLEQIWAQFPEEEKFSVFGGDMETHNEKMIQDENYQIPNEPGAYDMTYGENLTYSLLIPAEQLTAVDEAATMIHAMLANNFTSGVVHLTEGTDVAAFTAAVHEAIKNNPWMCGFPEKELIAVVGGDYVLIAFGVNDAMNPFQTHFAAAYPEAQIVYNDDLA